MKKKENLFASNEPTHGRVIASSAVSGSECTPEAETLERERDHLSVCYNHASAKLMEIK